MNPRQELAGVDFTTYAVEIPTSAALFGARPAANNATRTRGELKKAVSGAVLLSLLSS
jgi:hypothetical protein